jgi:hypothetical protein
MRDKSVSSQYCIWIVTPPGYPHAAAFDEVAIGLQGGFRELGLQAPIVRDNRRIRGKAIVLGANLLPDMPGVKVPRKAILFNLEQITPGSEWLTPGYLKLLKHHTVWDYSVYNIEQLNRLGITNITHCPLGFSDELHCIQHAENKDIDVLFYGSMNARRLEILETLVKTGLKVETLFGVYGDRRDAVIARSRLVLNIHYYPAKIFEIVRISWLLANAVCVISEDSPPESALESVRGGIVQAPYAQLVETCRKMIDDGTWATMASRGLEVFRNNRQAGFLRTALGLHGESRLRA